MQRFLAAIQQFDAASSLDTNLRVFAGQEYPHALLYGQRMTYWLQRLAPDASEAVQLAARGQHLCRWMIPRSQYPMNRAGYFRWRTRLYEFHAERAGQILSEVGYDEATTARVQDLLRKKNLRTNPEMQLLEDVACLVFLEGDLGALVREQGEDKVINILKKTWRKMSPQGRQAAFEVPLSEAEKAILAKATAGGKAES